MAKYVPPNMRARAQLAEQAAIAVPVDAAPEASLGSAAAQPLAASEALPPSLVPEDVSIFLRPSSLDALWVAYVEDIDFDQRLSKELNVSVQESPEIEANIKMFIIECFDRSEMDQGCCFGTHFAGVLLNRWIRSGTQLLTDGNPSGGRDAHTHRLAIVRKAFEILRERDVIEELEYDHPKVEMYLDEVEMIAMESQHRAMLNIFLVRNGAMKIWQQMRQQLRGSVCVRSPGSLHEESPEGKAEMKEIIAKAMGENHRIDASRFDIFMTHSRGIDSAAEFYVNLSADVRTSMAPDFVLLSPASLQPVERMLKARRKFQEFSRQPRVLIALSANDLMDFPCATHPNVSAHSLVDLVAVVSDRELVSSPMIRRVRRATAAGSDASQTLAWNTYETQTTDCSRLVSCLKDIAVVCETELSGSAMSSDVALYIFEDLVAPWDVKMLGKVVQMWAH